MFLHSVRPRRAWRVAFASVLDDLGESFRDGGCADSSTLNGRNSYSSASAGVRRIIFDTPLRAVPATRDEFNLFRKSNLNCSWGSFRHRRRRVENAAAIQIRISGIAFAFTVPYSIH